MCVNAVAVIRIYCTVPGMNFEVYYYVSLMRNYTPTSSTIIQHGIVFTLLRLLCMQHSAVVSGTVRYRALLYMYVITPFRAL